MDHFWVAPEPGRNLPFTHAPRFTCQPRGMRGSSPLRGLWLEIAWVAEDHWRWALIVPPVTVFTVWSGVACVSALRAPAPIPPRVPWLGGLSPAWQVGVLLGVAMLWCAWWVYSAADFGSGDDPGILGALPEFAVAAIVLIAEMGCCAAAQSGARSPGLLISAVGLLCSAVLTLTYRVSMEW
ncbi:MAG: hypothetical protein J2P40_12325 [Candidatus Dormibacteraeota bacterium]|nr:hypothetical protein [Candidatus Dormibacteraeota bacterium]MBO0762053.1 hypothetical protein [Candidatus Dormibacteraeota bacterium]